MSEPTTDVLCKNCGKTFPAFLKEMADKNSEVTCPHCGENSQSENAMPPATTN